LHQSSNRIFPTYGHGIKDTPIYKGRVDQITIIAPPSGDHWRFEKKLKSRFVDYAEEEWTSYEIDGWTFWQTGYSEEAESKGATEADLGSAAE